MPHAEGQIVLLANVLILVHHVRYHSQQWLVVAEHLFSVLGPFLLINIDHLELQSSLVQLSEVLLLVPELGDFLDDILQYFALFFS